MSHPIQKKILESLVATEQGFELDPKAAKPIAKLLYRDAAATAAFYETLSVLRLTNGVKAAKALEQLLLDGALGRKKPEKPGWNAR